MRIARGLLAAALLLGAGACSDSPETPEAAIREMISRAEAGAEAGDIEPFEDAMDAEFQGEGGRDRGEVLNLLRLYMLRHQALHAIVRVEEIDVYSADDATATVLVATARRPIDSPEALSGYRTGVHRVELSLELIDGMWQVYRAQWERASVGALIKLW